MAFAYRTQGPEFESRMGWSKMCWWHLAGRASYPTLKNQHTFPILSISWIVVGRDLLTRAQKSIEPPMNRLCTIILQLHLRVSILFTKYSKSYLDTSCHWFPSHQISDAWCLRCSNTSAGQVFCPSERLSAISCLLEVLFILRLHAPLKNVNPAL